ncbi:hypothetical protein RRG08_045291 [Elysia crispata]|uniref:Uncharacterized protein n=1 Tax=Elysia crispata TaxID=231223 RepID=A0AAE1A1X0_9GAST|nr:hypothetical protein RRG08_045291 [Elysia crispata]
MLNVDTVKQGNPFIALRPPVAHSGLFRHELGCADLSHTSRWASTIKDMVPTSNGLLKYNLQMRVELTAELLSSRSGQPSQVEVFTSRR